MPIKFISGVNKNYVNTQYNQDPPFRDLKKGMAEWLGDFKFGFFITANFNRETSFDAGREKLRKWHQKLDRKIYGKYFSKKEPEDRTFFFAFPEIGGKTGGLHYHLLLKVPDDKRREFQIFASGIWEKIVPSGDLDVRSLKEEIDQVKTKNYSIKDSWKTSNYDNFILSTEFSNTQ